MQSAETVLGVLRERGRRGLPCEELYRQLFNPQLYLLAYGRIYANKGAMTPGVTQDTVDGMSLGKIGRIIDAMRHERYRFRPVRRVLYPEKEREDPSARAADLDGQAGWRGGAPAVGGVLRAAVLRPLARVPAWSGLSYRAAGGGQHLDGDDLVRRGRHLRLFREFRSLGDARDPGGEDPRQPVPAADA